MGPKLFSLRAQRDARLFSRQFKVKVAVFSVSTLSVLSLAIATLCALVPTVSQAQMGRDAGASAASRTISSAPAIFDVRKSLPMEPGEKAYHDFYINAGVEAGFKKGQYLPVERLIPVHDPVQNKQQALLTIPVGQVLVIHAESGITVARRVQELSNEERPTLEYEAIMIGDRINMKGITTTPPKAKAPSRAEAGPGVSSEVGASEMRAGASVAVAAPAARAEGSGGGTAPVGAPGGASGAVDTGASGAGAGKVDSAAQPSAPIRVTQPVPPPTA
jgi:hypothetical protein